jgi:hypothetical protein
MTASRVKCHAFQTVLHRNTHCLRWRSEWWNAVPKCKDTTMHTLLSQSVNEGRPVGTQTQLRTSTNSTSWRRLQTCQLYAAALLCASTSFLLKSTYATSSILDLQSCAVKRQRSRSQPTKARYLEYETPIWQHKIGKHYCDKARQAQ